MPKQRNAARDPFKQLERLPRRDDLTVLGGKRTIGLYLHEDGQTFQPDLGRLNWKGWKLVTIPLDGSGAHWGGANNGALNGALHWEGLLLIDSADQKKAHSGEILIANPIYVMGGN